MKTLSEYFLELWRTASAWRHVDRAQASTRDSDLLSDFNAILLLDDEQKIVAALIGKVRASPQATIPEISIALTCMVCINEMFMRIHPRFFKNSGSVKIAKPFWLEKYERTRLEFCYFSKNEKNYLLPRGPLLRNNRSEHASSAEDLADRFNALSVCQRTFYRDGHQIKIEVLLVNSHTIHGVPLGTRTGSERIACAAIAEAPSDIDTKSRLCGDNGFILYQMADTLKPADRLLEVLQQAGSLDIALAPELVMSKSEAERLSDMLSSTSMHDCRLIVAGSGNAPSSDGKPPWNESQILNSSGYPLWTQRKLWPAQMKAAQAKELAFCPHPSAAVYFEDNSDSDTLLIADVDGLGRCLVLICQDLKENFIGELLRQYQPDWVFTPILDTGIDPGRWHQRTIFPLSEISQARFIVSSCMSLAMRKDSSARPILGMFHGPQMPETGELGRCVAFEPSQTSSSPYFVTIDWGKHGWGQSQLGASPA